MGICFSEPPQSQDYRPPVQQTTVMRYTNCKQCGGWVKQNLDYCDVCLQKNAMKVITPSAPPMYPTQQQYQQQYPQYTYAVQYPPQQTYYQQQPIAFVSTPYQQQYRPPQQQMGTATAMGTGFLAGMIAESMLDPTE